MNEETKKLIAKWHLAQVSAEDFSDWAVSSIEQGIETKNILILASIINPQSLSEVEDYFRRSLKDLNWEFPSRDQNLFEYAKTTATEIIEKKIDPFAGVLEISQVYRGLDYPKGLSNFDYLNWIDELTDEQLKCLIVEEAHLLANFKGTLDQLREKEFSTPYFREPLVMKTEKNESFVSKLWRKIF